MSQEKRDDSLRIPVSIAVEAGDGDDQVFLFSKNVSMTGMYLEADTLLPEEQGSVDQILNILFYLPTGSGSTLAAKARVVRREQITKHNGEAAHGIAVEFIDIDPADRERLRLFISDYETELEQTILTEEIARGEDEVTDPETILESMTGRLLIEPLLVDDYKYFFEKVEAIEVDLKNKREVDLTPMQLLMLDIINSFTLLERRQLRELVKIEAPDLKQKIFLNLLLLRLKVMTESHLLKGALEKENPQEDAREFLTNYYTSTCFEVEQCIEAAHLVSQKLVGEENWDEFKSLNVLQNELDKSLKHLGTVLEPYNILPSEPIAQEIKESAIEVISLEESISDIEDIIPDPDEEADPFNDGATGEEVLKLWNTIFGLNDTEVKKQLVRALALRRKVRYTYLQCRELDEEIVHYRDEITEIFRDDAKLIRETINTLTQIQPEAQDERDCIGGVVRLLERLAYYFGQLVRTIPYRMLSTAEVDTVRYRRTTFRRRSKSKVHRLKLLSLKYAPAIALAITLIFTAGFHGIRNLGRYDKVVPIRLVEDLPVLRAFRNDKCLFVVVDQSNWRKLSDSQKAKRVSTLLRIAREEHANRFKLLDQKNALLAVSFDTRDTFATSLY